MVQENNRDNNGRFKPGNSAGFKPGVVTNPTGRPPGVSITTELKKLLKKVHPKDKLRRKYVELLAEATFNNALKGNGTAMRICFDRVDGLVGEQTDGSQNANSFAQALTGTAEEVWAGVDVDECEDEEE